MSNPNDTTEPQSLAADVSQPQVKQGGLGLGWKALILFSIIGWATVGGLITAIWRTPTPVASIESPLTPTLADPATNPDYQLNYQLPEGFTLSDADDLLISGSYAEALKSYVAIGERDSTAGDLRLIARLALANEALGNWDAAVSQYRSLGDLSEKKDIAAYFQARTNTARGRPAAAEPILARILLTSQDPRLRSVADHLFAQTLAKKANIDRDILAGGVVAPKRNLDMQQSLWLLDAYFHQEMPLDAAPATLAIGDTNEIEYVESFGEHPEEVELKANVDSMDLMAFANQAAANAKLKLEWTESATLVCRSRSITVRLHRETFARLLDLTLSPHGLIWQYKKGVIKIASVGELPTNETSRLIRESVARNLRHASASYPEAPQGDKTLLWLANLSFVSGEYPLASSYYEQLLRQFPNTKARTEVRLNLGKSLLYEGRTEHARREFYWVADQTRGLEIEPTAYVFVARSFMEETNPEAALQPVRRAISLAVDPQLKRTAILLLVAAYALNENPNAALLELSEHVSEFRRGIEHDQAAFLSAIARFALARGDKQIERTARELITTSSRVDPESFFGGYGYWLLGDAFDDLGLLTQAANVYGRGVKSVPTGPLKFYLQLQSARSLVALGDGEKGLKELIAVAQTEQQPWAVDAQLKVIEMKLDEGETDWCLQAARSLIAVAKSDHHRRELLQLIGKIYQTRRDHYRAALCFSGLLPPEEPTPATETES